MQQYLAVTEQEEHVTWLERVLGPEVGIVVAEEPSVERILQLVDGAGTSLVFVRFGAFDHRERGQLVSSLIEHKPYLSVIAIAESDAADVVLSAMRAGARDFVTVGAEAADLQDTVRRVLERAPAELQAPATGVLWSTVCARPEMAVSALAVHLALALCEEAPGEGGVLLVDLGLPAGDSLLFLDLRPSYDFVDAVRSVRRFDQTLVKAAFTQHKSGLAVLPLPEDPAEMDNVNGTDALALLSLLKSYFKYVIVNLSGFFAIDLLVSILGKSERILLHSDQCVASCRASRRLLDAIQRERVDISNVKLIVDRYQPKLEPTAEQIAEILGVASHVCIPSFGTNLIQAMNRGKSVYDIAPTIPYARAVRALARELSGREAGAEEPTRGSVRAWLARLTGRV